ncbi:MAG: hypothetical protein PCFJNLEI_01268 [Verrucomicrobiae bacterium]|nr:hypothetical protein [Verrucomicrobiae bacterium]
MRIEIHDDARHDLIAGFHFYEKQEAGLGTYFLDYLFSDIDSLQLYAGIHAIVFNQHRCLSKRFPFAVYYTVIGDTVHINAVLDCRRNPTWIKQRLT